MSSVWKEFKEFAFKGNVVDLAIGLVIGAAFGAIIKSFVDNLVNPLVGLIGGGKAALDGLAIHVTPKVSITYGAFLSAVLNFLIVALALFIVIKAVDKFRRQEESTERECPFCLTLVPKAATRCSACTSELQPE
jgi:large conductance mechanosensitive channel